MTNLLSTEQLEKLTTARLLAYKSKLMKYPETPNWGDSLLFKITKSHPKWIETYTSLKAILATREHVND